MMHIIYIARQEGKGACLRIDHDINYVKKIKAGKSDVIASCIRAKSGQYSVIQRAKSLGEGFGCWQKGGSKAILLTMTERTSRREIVRKLPEHT